MRRRLAAILAVDMVGYSRLMSSAEEDTIARQKAHRSDHIDPLIAQHNGRVVKTTGDGLLVEFSSVVDAVKCALAYQKSISEREAAEPPERRIRYRIGINLGDIVIDEDDILGDGVNVAARLEGLAEPGGICVSATVREHVGNRLPVRFADMGEHHVKNIVQPVRAYKVLAEAEETRAEEPQKEEVLFGRPPVAVLPFVNMSGDVEQDYFSDGLTEEITTALALWRSFPVIARNSSFAYKGKAVDVKRIGHELGARYVLEGSVRRSGNRLRVTAQLIDTDSGHHVWVEKLDRELDEVFALQDELTNRIAASLGPAIGKAELVRSRTKPPENLDAWDYYLRGRAHLHEFTKEGHVEARRMFMRAIELDPNYCEAFASLAWTHSRDLLLEFTDDRGESITKLYEAARRAVALDDESSLAHHLLSTAYIWRDELDHAIAEGHRAVELNPSDADSRHALGNKLDLAGDPDGIVLMEQAQRLSPKDPQRHMQLSFLARAYLNARRYDEAVETAEKAIQWRPDYPNAYYIMAMGLALLGRPDVARARLDECEKLHPGFAAKRSDWRPYRDALGNRHLREAREKAGLVTQRGSA